MTTPSQVPSNSGSFLRRHRRWLLLGGIPAVLIAGAVVFWMVRPLFDTGRHVREAAPFAAVTDARTVLPAGQAGPGTVAAGALMGADSFHFGSGTVRLLRGPSSELALRFEGYEVRNGPDLFVYLSPDAAGNVDAGGAVNLGPVRATSGDVNYEVPRDIDLSKVRTAVIWCRAFSVTFATARLAVPGS